MWLILRILAISAALAALAALPALAHERVVIPMPPDAAPTWVLVPEVKGVYYTPTLQMDVFRHGGRYYCYYQGLWYRGGALAGPWQQVASLPPVFYQIGPTYFKAAPPGWAHGKKTGWRGAPLPPGQMKKYEEGKIPPGQLKKMYQ